VASTREARGRGLKSTHTDRNLASPLDQTTVPASRSDAAMVDVGFNPRTG
jgi:hypothetical protein